MKEIHLDKPIRAAGKTLNTITVRPSTVGDEEDAQAMAVDMGRPFVALTAEMCLFSVLTEVSYDDLRALSTPDYEKLRKAYNEVNRARPTRPVEEANDDQPATN